MVKTITFNNGDHDVTLTVRNCFSYVYNAFKNVLKIEISESDHSYNEVAELKECAGKIDYAVDGEVKAEYEGYNLGAEGFSVNYANGVFSVEMAQETSYEIRLSRLENTTERIMMMLMVMQ